MYCGTPGLTRVGVPPVLGTDQMAEDPSALRRPKKACVALMASTAMLVPSFGTRVWISNSKVALTCVSPVATTVHVGAAPVHAPPQVMNLVCVAGNAVSVIELPGGTVTSQVADGGRPQSMFPPFTCPGPETATATWISCGGCLLNLAVTWRSPRRAAMAHAPVPVQGPSVQPSKTKPGAGAASSVTAASSLKFALQVVESQARPFGVEVTVPDPSTTTVS